MDADGPHPPSAPRVLANDPRQPHRVHLFETKTNPDELPADWLALFSLIFGVSVPSHVCSRS